MDSVLATSPEACPPIPSATNAKNKPSALMHFIASSLFERSPCSDSEETLNSIAISKNIPA